MTMTQSQYFSQRVADFIAGFTRHNPVYTKKIVALAQGCPELFNELADPLLLWAENLLGKEYPERLFVGYEFFVTEVNQAQLAYETNKKYLYSSFSEVARHTYNSPDFMMLYHWGVYVTIFAWQHHLNIYKFFKERFLSRLARAKPGQIIDLGCGSGVWSLLTVSALPDWNGLGVDISPTSVQWAQKLAALTNFSGQCVFTEGDALLYHRQEPAQAGISCFLLEHLETPDKLLRNLHDSLVPGAPAFVTAAVSAAEIDHIYEFRKESEVVTMLEEAGFVVTDMLSSAPESFSRNRIFKPRSVAFVLTRKTNALW